MANTVHKDIKNWDSWKTIYRQHKTSKATYWIISILTMFTLFIFLPWTQNIRAKGKVTALRPEQRPQDLHAAIPGRILQWYVKEGDMVQAGDTLLQLAEIKEDYWDPQLLQRTQEQIDAKSNAAENYKLKADMAAQQSKTLAQSLQLKMAELQNKMQQQKMKIESDGADYNAVVNDYNIKKEQFRRQQSMYDSGLVSLTQLEQRNQLLQEALAKKTTANIKWENSKQELLRLQIEWNMAQQEYAEKIAKSNGERYQSISQASTGQSEVAKLRNQYSNYSIRNQMYYVIAPQAGQIVKTRKAGIGEVVKENEMIAEIVPTNIEYAVELYVKPLDVQLLSIGQKIRFVFDGFPAVVFSGWPKASYGTFGGKVTAIERNTSDDGNFKVLVIEDTTDNNHWPPTLKIGTAAQGIALLKDVPVWYELWRQINGFPPDYYKPHLKNNEATYYPEKK